MKGYGSNKKNRVVVIVNGDPTEFDVSDESLEEGFAFSLANNDEAMQEMDEDFQEIGFSRGRNGRRRRRY